MFYWARLYGSQLIEGEHYEDLKPAISIIILDYELAKLKDEEALTKWQIIETKNRKKILTEDLELCIIELPKALREGTNEDLLKWLMFLDNPNKAEVREMSEKDKVMKKAMERLEEVSEDEHMRRIAELKEKAIRDEASNLSGARREGIREGKIETAKNMLEKGFDIETIAEITKLTREEIKDIK